MLPVLSHYQAIPILQQRGESGSVEISLDLGLTTTSAALSVEGVRVDDLLIRWEWLEEIAGDENGCFRIDDEGPLKVKTFSEETNRAISLYPTREAPTMLVGGFSMHRIKNSTPNKDTLAKVAALRNISGALLDTCTGLGYTAIEAARKGAHVTTIELDPAVIEICRQNPWSGELFDNQRITQHIGHSWDVVEEMEDGSFDAIIHDPPIISLAGELYSLEYYQELRRVLRPGGALFHYIGNPETRTGASVTRGVLERLPQAGFTNARRYPKGFGVTARG